MSAKRKLRLHTTSCAAGSIDLQDMSRLVDAAASLTSADEVTLQGVLALLSVPERYPPLGAAVLFLFLFVLFGGDMEGCLCATLPCCAPVAVRGTGMGRIVECFVDALDAVLSASVTQQLRPCDHCRMSNGEWC
jgi:hypothetical protein